MQNLNETFDGAKVALFIGNDLLIYLRDDIPGLPWAGYWDFPGGGREGDETPFDTLNREVFEEFALDMNEASILWHHPSPALHNPDATVHFYVAVLPEKKVDQIVFGDEGQRWELRPVTDVLKMTQIVPSLPQRLRLFFENHGLDPHIPIKDQQPDD